MSNPPQGNIVPVFAPQNRELGGINPATCQHRWAFNKFEGHDYWCQTCLIPGRLVPGQPADDGSGQISRVECVDAIARTLLGETVVTNDRIMNHALQQAGEIIGRRDISPLDKFETLTAFVLKARRELLGVADK